MKLGPGACLFPSKLLPLRLDENIRNPLNSGNVIKQWTTFISLWLRWMHPYEYWDKAPQLVRLAFCPSTAYSFLASACKFLAPASLFFYAHARTEEHIVRTYLEKSTPERRTTPASCKTGGDAWRFCVLEMNPWVLLKETTRMVYRSFPHSLLRTSKRVIYVISALVKMTISGPFGRWGSQEFFPTSQTHQSSHVLFGKRDIWTVQVILTAAKGFRFRLVWLDIVSTGLDWFYVVFVVFQTRNAHFIFPKGHL